ncbi:hypothetical protein E308F_17960 [Moorella sp. E308F]|uniref:hypothetical protein n=1 Tax=unclassified Neomoorella TaxID=2676739 RepID=UPI0010FFB44D|nr:MULTISPECIES: hypothetical protein [unclassified Moorella (in: firmicutes)]GEA15552.1 hypothetical protein E308F_17960 [Moorella sp. E308F]GEA19590.1 hypothetical protein E306M_27280 [Moorella sp. E306M]
MDLPSYRIMAFLLSDPGAEIPWEWRDYMQPLIYSFIDDGGKIHSARYSLFSFALTPLDPVSGRDGAASGNGAWAFRFSSALTSVLEQVAASLRKSRELKIAGTAFRVSAVVEEALSDRAAYQTASPVLAAKLAFRDGGKPFWNPAESWFAAAVAKSLTNRWRFLTGEKPPSRVLSGFYHRARKEIWDMLPVYVPPTKGVGVWMPEGFTF